MIQPRPLINDPLNAFCKDTDAYLEGVTNGPLYLSPEWGQTACGSLLLSKQHLHQGTRCWYYGFFSASRTFLDTSGGIHWPQTACSCFR